MSTLPLEGTHDPRFDVVRDTFLRVLEEQPGTGASLAVWHGGSWVVDLWGGWADAAHPPVDAGHPGDAVLGDQAVRGGLRAAARRPRGARPRRPLTTYWPELTARTTMREVLAHRSGLVVLDEDAPEEVFYDWDRMCTLLAKQPPAWEPGTARGESALFYGHLVGEVVRRTDGRSLGGSSRTRSARPSRWTSRWGWRSRTWGGWRT